MNSFTIYPAIDIRAGKCVRLLQGDFNKETIYADDPTTVALQWVNEGAKWLHVVDLDGAKAGKPENHHIIQSIVNNCNVNVQTGGGVRKMEDVELLLKCGVQRIILGSAAINNQAFVKEALATYADTIAIGIDARNGYVATEGWLETSSVNAIELANKLVQFGATTFIYTDISRDGTLSGPNIDEIRQLAQASGASVIASGGVSHLDDLRSLSTYTKEGISGAIVGKALYEHRFTLKEAFNL